MEIEQSILPKLLSAGLLQEGEQLCFKNEIGTVTKSGVILYKEKHYPSIVEWMKEIITRLKLFEECTLSTVTIHNQSFARYLDLLGELQDEVPKLVVETKSPDHSTFPKKRKRESMDSSSTDEEVEFDAKKQKSSGNHTSKLSSDCQYPPSLRPLACTFPNCLVCGNQLSYNDCTLTWSGILEVTLLGLRASYPEKQFFRMKNDIRPYVEVHWDKLSSKPRSGNWKATINATVSRYSEIFDGGYNTLKGRGYWRLKNPSQSFHRYIIHGKEETKNCNPPVGPKAVENSATVVIDDGEDEPTTLGNYHRELTSSTSKTTVQSANIGSSKAAPRISPTIDADSYSNNSTSPTTLSFNGDTSANTILDLSKRVLRLEQEQVRYTQLVASLYKKLDDNKKRTGQNNEIPPQFAQDPYPKFALLYNRTQLPVNTSVRNRFKPRIMQLHPLDNLM